MPAWSDHGNSTSTRWAGSPPMTSALPARLPPRSILCVSLDQWGIVRRWHRRTGIASGRSLLLVVNAAPPPLEFRLFGGFRLRRGSWHVEDSAWDRRVAQRLVRYLLVKRGSAVPDDQLLEAFWPDKPAASARRSLRVAVSCARAVVDLPMAPSVIEVSEHTLALRLRERDSVDVDRFEDAARVAFAASDGDRRPLLERAAALWAGEPLPEERYEDWANPWREDLELRYGEVLRALGRACRAEGDYLAAARAAQRLVELDPLDEAAQRELMLAYARSGRRSHALRQYLECRRALIEGLGVEPARETQELHGRLLAGDPV
jgi:DNA-binding SARP family transcriptional activator